MNWDWIDLDELRPQYKQMYGKNSGTLISILRPLVHSLQSAYPDGKIWLMTPARSRKEFRNHGRSDLLYILPWAFERGFLQDSNPGVQEYRRAMLEYLLTRRRKGSSPFKKWALHWKFVSDSEFAIADTLKPRKRCGGTFELSLAMHTFLLMKPLASFTEQDVEYAQELSKSDKYSSKSLQDLRVRLGYSSILPEKRIRTKWDSIVNDPYLGPSARKFRSYLVDGDYRRQALNSMGVRLKELAEFLEQKGLTTCCCFGEEQWAELLESLQNGPRGPRKAKSVLCAFSQLLHFFRWGIGDPFFPPSMDLPSMEWGRLQLKALGEQWQSNGHAFESLDVAENLIAEILRDDPVDDRGKLCRWFMMIAASSPPRFSFILNLAADRTIAKMPNDPNAMGLHSPDADKAGIQYGQFPVLDKMGVEAVHCLQDRAKRLGLSPLYNRTHRRSYVHLFQLPDPPWVLRPSAVRRYLDCIKQRVLESGLTKEPIKGGAHALRTHILTFIAQKTGSLAAVQLAAGHRNEQMTRVYLKSRISRTALLYRVVEQYERSELTGRFFFQVIRVLTSDETPADAMLAALAQDMTLEEFLARFGKRLEMGHCLNQQSCENWFRCWSCQHFVMRQDEIHEAIHTLASQIKNMRSMIRFSRNFTYENSIASGQMRAIGHLIKRILDLGVSEMELEAMLQKELGTNSAAKAIGN